MKTTLAFIITLILAAISASVWAMPCARNAGALQEVRDSQHQVRLHVARQEVTPASDSILHPRPALFRASGQIIALAI